MPQDITKETAPTGTVVYQWTVKEYEQHVRDRRWYAIMGSLAALLIVYALVTANYLFAIIIVLFGVIVYLHDVQTPLSVSFAITDTGIILGKKFYRYSELKSFWIIYNPPLVKNLYFAPQSFFKHRLQVPLLDYDPRPVREALGQYLPEDLEQEEEPMSDRLGRLLKLH